VKRLGLGLVPLLIIGLAVWYYWRLGERREQRQDAVILAAARRYEVNPALIKAVVWKESRFDPEARGGSGEIGLMQIREPAAREWAEAEGLSGFRHEDLFDPGSNTLCGTWYLRKMLRRYGHTDNPVPYALADYNAGRTHVLRWNDGPAVTNSAVFFEQIDFPGTRGYIIETVDRFRHYHANGVDDQVPASGPHE
jgi:soluble lytic murein transglycosylase